MNKERRVEEKNYQNSIEKTQKELCIIFFSWYIGNNKKIYLKSVQRITEESKGEKN